MPPKSPYYDADFYSSSSNGNKHNTAPTADATSYPSSATRSDEYMSRAKNAAPDSDFRIGFDQRPYRYRNGGTNSQGNHYCSRDYGPGAPNQNSYHYSNTNGSYYYSNPDGSRYHNDGQGSAMYCPPGRDDWLELQNQKFAGGGGQRKAESADFQDKSGEFQYTDFYREIEAGNGGIEHEGEEEQFEDRGAFDDREEFQDRGDFEDEGDEYEEGGQYDDDCAEFSDGGGGGGFEDEDEYY